MGMPQDNVGGSVPVFAPDQIIDVVAGDMNTDLIAAILFDVDQTIKIGFSAGTFLWEKGKPLGIARSVGKINLSAPGKALVMSSTAPVL